MKTYKESELDNIRCAGEILSAALLAAQKAVKPGISTLQLDKVAEDYILGRGAEPCFKDVNGYGFATCISVNEEVVHGMPRADKILKEGDIVSIDVGARWNGFCTDAARTFGVGKISENAQKLIDETKQSFFEAIKTLKAGSSVGEIGRRIEDYIRANTTFSILTNYFGHGIGRKVHEEPLIPNFRPKIPQLVAVCRKKLLENSVICIEPMINEGAKEVKTKADGWTVVTVDGKLAAHYENTVIIHKDKVEIVTDKYI